jgi:hypothetical protein
MMQLQLADPVMDVLLLEAQVWHGKVHVLLCGMCWCDACVGVLLA